MPFQALLGGLHLQSQLLDASEDGIEGTEVCAGVGRDDPGQGGLAHAGWSMEDQIADPIGLDRPSQQASIGKDSALPLEFIQGARPHPVRQRGQAASDLFPLKAEEILTQGSTSTDDGITVSGQSANADDRGLD